MKRKYRVKESDWVDTYNVSIGSITVCLVIWRSVGVACCTSDVTAAKAVLTITKLRCRL